MLEDCCYLMENALQGDTQNSTFSSCSPIRIGKNLSLRGKNSQMLNHPTEVNCLKHSGKLSDSFFVDSLATLAGGNIIPEFPFADMS